MPKKKWEKAAKLDGSFNPRVNVLNPLIPVDIKKKKNTRWREELMLSWWGIHSTLSNVIGLGLFWPRSPLIQLRFVQICE